MAAFRNRASGTKNSTRGVEKKRKKEVKRNQRFRPNSVRASSSSSSATARSGGEAITHANTSPKRTSRDRTTNLTEPAATDRRILSSIFPERGFDCGAGAGQEQEEEEDKEQSGVT